MANTIQKKIKFSKGQIVPELVERTDMEFYDSSAQEMTNVVSSVYGGIRSRRGTNKVDRLLSGMIETTGTATTALSSDASGIQDKSSTFTSEYAVGNKRNIFTIDYGSEQPGGTLKVRGIKFDFVKPVIKATVSSNVKRFTYRPKASRPQTTVDKRVYYYSAATRTNPGVGVTSTDTITRNPSSDWVSYKDTTTTVGPPQEQVKNPVMSFSLNSKGQVSSFTISNGGESLSEVKSDLIFTRKSGKRYYSATAYYSSDGNTWTAISTKTISETAQDFDFVISENFRYFKFQIDQQNADIGTTLSMQYAILVTGTYSKGNVKLVDYVYNNQDKYVFVLGYETISVYKDDSLVATVNASGLYTDYFAELKWTYKDDTIVFTHPDMQPKILKRVSGSSWSWGNLDLKNIPYTLFGAETTATKTVGITPSATDGTVKITADSSVFASSWVGQYIDGNGGRVKITEYVSGTVVNGVTVIPFYTTDKITSWTYISGYAQAWSATKGWPRTCLFAQQRLWFGGSKNKPSTVWASRLGDYFNFKNTGNYDNDSISVDLVTNDVIVNMIENRGIHILTTGQEISTSENGYTPDKISFTINTKNGSLSRIRPVVICGTVCFVEKNGKSLLSYVYNYDQASYLANNLSLFTDLVKDPVSMVAEINSSKDKGDFLYMVLDDGTMIVGCILIDQNIISLSKFKTDGNIIDVCSVGGDTYILVDRGNYNYLEKIVDVQTDLTTNVSVFPNPQETIYGWEHEGEVKYTLSDTPSVSDPVYDVYLDATGETISAVSEGEITVNGVVYTATEAEEKSVMYVNVLSDYEGKYVYLYDGQEIYEKQIVSNGRIILQNPLNKTCYVGLVFDYKVVGNPIAINHKTTSIKKRITTADIVCKDTPKLTFCGQDKAGGDNYKFFSCTKYGDDTRYTISGEFYKVQILSIQLNINYEG